MKFLIVRIMEESPNGNYIRNFYANSRKRNIIARFHNSFSIIFQSQQNIIAVIMSS